MNVVIVKYAAGNIYSVVQALRRLGVNPVLTDDLGLIAAADRVVLPGQGEAFTTMQSLRSKGIDRLLPTLKQPVLGICIGQQLLCAHSDEGGVDCLGVFPVTVRRFEPCAGHKVPHVGWNTLQPQGASPLLRGIERGDYAYFIHSYYVPPCPFTTALTDYIVPFSAALAKDNFFATQFHPEKSGAVGRRILKNFLDL